MTDHLTISRYETSPHVIRVTVAVDRYAQGAEDALQADLAEAEAMFATMREQLPVSPYRVEQGRKSGLDPCNQMEFTSIVFFFADESLADTANDWLEAFTDDVE